ncbi:MAG: hypothetical protein V4643_11015 [Bacteroidota bacterium]
MRQRLIILYSFILVLCYTKPVYSQWNTQLVKFEFYGDSITVPINQSTIFKNDFEISESFVKSFYNQLDGGNYETLVNTLLSYKKQLNLNDWLYYQLIRKTAQELSPKQENYNCYTLYKWFLLTKSGYDATLVIGKNQILFYVKSDDNIYDIPFYMSNGKQYVCLNYHDYGKINFETEKLFAINIDIPEAINSFSYKVTQLPNFKPETYAEKDLSFNYKEKSYHFKVKLNNEVQTIFKNYPVVDFATYFNIPLSRETHSTLIPLLKANIQSLSQKEGIDYLMHFTRYAFLYENDQDNFGKEKRLSPEQTLLYEHSDCDDRAALFFYLVKEIYNLPMIALLYPTHVTIAVQFDKPQGKPITYNGRKYSICDPTPQAEDLLIGQITTELKKTSFQVVYEYIPQATK